MMDSKWKEQLSDYAIKTQPEKVIWLTKLLYFISMYARLTYTPGTDGLEHPEQLRKFNELIHRIAQFQYDVARNKERRSDVDFFDFISTEVNEHGLTDILITDLGKLK